MKIASILTVFLFVVWVILAIVDLWFDIVPWAVFIKITLTFGLLAVLAMVLSISKRQMNPGSTGQDSTGQDSTGQGSTGKGNDHDHHE